MLHFCITLITRLMRIKSVQLIVFAVGWIAGGVGVVYGAMGIWRTGDNTPLLQSELGKSALQANLGTLIVDVSGAVISPGTYSIAAGGRVGEALQAAGGLAAKADYAYIAEKLNLAEALVDGQKLYIPFERPMQEIAEVLGSAVQQPVSTGININTASQKELETLPGIGAKRAADIIAGRPYATASELLDREIITQKIMDGIKELVSTN